MMNLKKIVNFERLAVIGSALVLGAALSGNVQAMPLPPNSSLTNPNEGLAGTNYTDGVLAAFGGALHGGITTSLANLNSPMTGAFSGNVESWVFGDSITPTQLIFAYQWTMTQGANDPDLIRSTIGDASNPWAGFNITDAGADNSGASGTPIEDEWFDGDPNFLLRDPAGTEGISVQWRAQNIGTTLQLTDTSSLIWFLVEAESWKETNVGLLDSGQVGSARGLAPNNLTVPEPTALVLLGLGFAGIGVARRRRKVA